MSPVIATEPNMVGPTANVNGPPFTILGRLLSKYRLILTFFVQIGRWSHLSKVFRLCGIWLMSKVGDSLWHLWLRLLKHWFTTSITIREDDDIYAHFMEWISQHPSIKNWRSLLVKTRHKSIWDSIENPEDCNEGDTEGFINSSHQENGTSLTFTPNFGFFTFLHKDQRFFMQRTQISLPAPNSSAPNSSAPTTEDITVTFIGRSTLPLKNLLSDAKSVGLQKKAKTTIIYRPGPENMRRFGQSMWVCSAERHARPMETVVLDEQIKKKLLDDINKYLHPESLVWYATRGIPYRRGYLFYGPPGTGKTSLVLAIAGIFGLAIYLVSLADPALTGDDLAALFAKIPRKCIVLLEDIDAVILAQQRTGDTKENLHHMSLADVLGSIDGVDSPEGRILIMTTNHPEHLDKALIRPGRIDLKVCFELAKKDQIRDLFIRLYSNDILGISNIPMEFCISLAASKYTSNSKELMNAATKFADKIPSGKLSPATIQDFILTRRNDPFLALEEVDGWVKSEMESSFDQSEGDEQVEKISQAGQIKQQRWQEVLTKWATGDWGS